MGIHHRTRLLTIALMIGFLAALVAACASRDHRNGNDRALRDPLVVYSDMLNPPFSSWDENGVAVGLEVDLVAEAAEALGTSVEWIEKPFLELLPAAASGEADISASTIGITKKRARTVAFSQPYHWTEIAVVVRAGANEPSTLSDLAGKRVGAGRGTTSETAVRERLDRSTGVFDRDEDDTFDAMLARGEIDAMVLDAPAAERMIAESDAPLRRLDEPLGHERYAFALHPEADELRAAIDAVIERRIERP